MEEEGKGMTRGGGLQSGEDRDNRYVPGYAKIIKKREMALIPGNAGYVKLMRARSQIDKELGGGGCGE